MEIATPAAVAEVLAGLPARCRGVMADPAGLAFDAAGLRAGADAVLALVGPEGGFTAAELAAAEHAGAGLVNLGPHILRVETAAVALAARLV
jgi:16S rRNA (uracil1498-N3)-methyltransferase